MTSTKQLVRDIEEVNTEIVLQRFADCTLLLITQLGKVGNLIRARIPDTAQLAPAPPLDPDEPNVIPLPPAPAGIEIVPFLGTASTEHIRTLHSLYASQAATLVWASSETAGLLEVDRKDVVVGIALRRDNRTHSGTGLTEYERRMFHGIMGLVKEVLVQG